MVGWFFLVGVGAFECVAVDDAIGPVNSLGVGSGVGGSVGVGELSASGAAGACN